MNKPGSQSQAFCLWLVAWSEMVRPKSVQKADMAWSFYLIRCCVGRSVGSDRESIRHRRTYASDYWLHIRSTCVRGFLVPKVGIEPTHPKIHDFESCASTNSATLACLRQSPISRVYYIGSVTRPWSSGEGRMQIWVKVYFSPNAVANNISNVGNSRNLNISPCRFPTLSKASSGCRLSSFNCRALRSDVTRPKSLRQEQY